MTALQRLVKREAQRSHDHGRPIIVSLEPGDLIGFRLKGTRTAYRTTILACYSLAARTYAAAVKKQEQL